MKPHGPAGPATVLALSGDLDVFGVSAAWDTLRASLAEADRGLVVDLSGAGDFDAAGLQLLLALRRSCRERGVPLAFRGLPAAWAERIGALGAGRFFDQPAP